MMYVPAGLLSDRPTAECTQTLLFLPQPAQPLPTHQGLHHLLGETLSKVMVPSRVVRVGFRFDLEVLPIWKVGKPQNPKALDGEHPVAATFPAEVAPFDPALAFARMPSPRPSPQQLEQQVIHFAKYFVHRDAPVILRPTPNQR